ncbi:TonB-dependent receptor [Rheinheimera riviphila]|uniref:TonB-dependent receptor n=1 Tax=Rheinheimera riviphila TaxID=1834037 RepID=A0A437R507_9GAMM|nr:TonB-dependent receptor [Rheinheimera riviphila]RVU41856.1 TonB-dependent receptor [Rheinheimera riviphila]
MAHNNNKALQPTLLAVAISCVLFGAALPAAAQQQAAAKDKESAALEVIQVTARRTAENLQTVPVAVTSIGAEDLKQKGIENITSVQQYSPNTTLQVSRGTNSTLTAYIRGIGQQDPLWGFEPGVGIYIDDVYMARPQGAALDIYDVERIEVLRGPQGTLYGRNTIGGAVKYVTKALSGDNEFAVRGTLGSYGQQDLKLSGQTAITDKLFIGAAGAVYQRDGFGTYLNTGAENYDKDIVTGRISLQYQAMDNLRFAFAADDTQDDSNSKGGHRLTPSLLTKEAPPSNVFDSNTSMPEDNSVETSGQSLTMTWDVNADWTIKAVSAKREGVTDTNIDFDSTRLASLDVPAFYEDEQTSHELQFLYNSDKLKFASGLYSFNGEACGAFGTVIVAGAGVTVENGGCVDTDSIAAYAQGSYQYSDQWSFTLGGRYTKDDKDANVFRFMYLGNKHPRVSGGTVLQVQTNFENSASFNHFSPRVGFEFQATDSVMYYGSYTDGFKSGGFDMRAVKSLNPSADQPYQPETVDTFELGVKSEWFERRLRLNAAVFSSAYDDMQVTVQRAVGNNVASQVLNAASASIDGLELEATLAATDALQLNLIVGYTDANFDEVRVFDIPSQSVIDVSNLWSFANTPKLTGTFGGKYVMEVGGGELVLNAAMSHRSDTQIFELPSMLDFGSYTLFNAGATWYAPDGHWDVSLQGRNLGNKEVRIAGYNFALLAGEQTITGYYADPRTVSLSVGYRF